MKNGQTDNIAHTLCEHALKISYKIVKQFKC